MEGIYLLTSGVPDQPAEICNSYLEEASAGRPIKLHVTLFSIDEADVAVTDGAGDTADVLPCRYASTSQTAQVLQDMAHSTAGGRFHWVRETGELLTNITKNKYAFIVGKTNFLENLNKSMDTYLSADCNRV